ncbi:inverse autotransporter beta domain-containing protein, partial [Pseudomonas viridiflava]|uniref:inverse autotransporter beta domain-containing protein n=1 Tax=Pseudomonas viridiflava TaxID=33069 RepID=UPI001968305F
LGVEAWTDFLKLSANSYQRLSNWKSSPDRADYEERAARGWDVRAEGYLPAYPQLGGQMIFEKYYGDEVSLFSANDRQKNPHAMTLGAIYNPVPLLSLGANHRIGQDGRADSAANLTFNYRLGES